MIRSIFWKEWHEHRSKYIGYWLIMNAPVLLLAIAIAFTSGARTPFTDLSDATVMKYLPLSLIQTLMVTTIFLLLTGYLAVATFGPEIDDRSMFFMCEQPLSRRQYLSIKFLYGACHVLFATTCAIVLLPAASYGMMLLSGKVTAAGSAGAFAVVMAAAARSAVWCSLISLAGFAISALIAVLVPRWWLAAICSVLLIALLIYYGSDFFSYFPDIGADSVSVSMNFSTGDSHWISITRALTPAEIAAFAPWKLTPLATAMVLAAAFFGAATLLYNRKEFK